MSDTATNVPASSTNAALNATLRTFQWSSFDGRAAILPLPAILVALLVGVAAGHPYAALVAAGGAQSAGFGAYQQPLFFRGGAIAFASIGMALSASVGCLVGAHMLPLTLIAVIWAFAYGMAGAISGPAQWVLQQCCVFLVVSSAFHGSPQSAFLRGAGVLAGGALQWMFIMLLWRFVAPAPGAVPNPEKHPPGWRIAAVRQNMTIASPIFRFALRLSFIAACSVLVYRALHFTNSYWIPMTALLLPKPERQATLERDVGRVLGTIVGAGIATIIAVVVHPQTWMVIVLIEVFMWAAYAMQNVNYALYVVMLTGYIAFLLALTHQPEVSTVWHRMIATAIGGVIAIVAYLIHINTVRILKPAYLGH